MTVVIDAVATLLAGAAVIAGATTLAATRDVKLSIGVLLDLLLAAGLIRLALPLTPERLAAAAALIAIRKLVSLGFGASFPGASLHVGSRRAHR